MNIEEIEVSSICMSMHVCSLHAQVCAQSLNGKQDPSVSVADLTSILVSEMEKHRHQYLNSERHVSVTAGYSDSA